MQGTPKMEDTLTRLLTPSPQSPASTAPPALPAPRYAPRSPPAVHPCRPVEPPPSTDSCYAHVSSPLVHLTGSTSPCCSSISWPPCDSDDALLHDNNYQSSPPSNPEPPQIGRASCRERV